MFARDYVRRWPVLGDRVESVIRQAGVVLPDPNSSATAGSAKSRQLVDPLAGIEPVNWPSFWSQEDADEEWMAEPLIPTGRQVAIFSVAKLGKSLLSLDIAAALATGRSVLGHEPVDPVSVVYCDLEMTADDLRQRLVDLGYGPESDLSRLAYYQLPNLPPLDSERGGEAMAQIVERHEAQLVVVDTMARAVAGPEDDADTYRDFCRHTGRRLKEARISLLRLDHAGKDPSRGQRGSSSKDDDVDIVFHLTVVESRIVLKRTRTRVVWVPAEVALERQDEPNTRHVLVDNGWPSGTGPVARLLDELDVPLDATITAALKMLKAAGHGKRRTVVMAALKWRRSRLS